MIVMSTHGRTGFSHVLLGSVTEKVVRTAPCPVVSIHPSEVANEEKKEAASS
jgi:nucleotide-binding universal stress UspA family protein